MLCVVQGHDLARDGWFEGLERSAVIEVTCATHVVPVRKLRKGMLRSDEDKRHAPSVNDWYYGAGCFADKADHFELFEQSRGLKSSELCN